MAKIKYTEEENWPWSGQAQISKLDNGSYLASVSMYETWNGSTMTMLVEFDSKKEAMKAVKKVFNFVGLPKPVWY